MQPFDGQPTPDQLADALRSTSPTLATNLLAAHDLQVTVDSYEPAPVLQPGWATETITTVDVVHAEWTWHSRTLGPRPQSACLLQVTTGGRDSGEGWAHVTHYVIDGPTTPEQRAAAAGLVGAGITVHRIGTTDL